MLIIYNCRLVKNFSKKFIESHKELNFTEKLKEKIKDIKSMKFQPYDECLKNPVEILEDERVSITEGNKPMIARTKSDNETAEEAQTSDECYLTDSAIKAMKNYLCFLRSTPVRQGTAFPITGTTGALRMGVVVDDGVAVFFPNKDFLFWNVTDIVRITGDGAGNIMLVLAHRTGDAVIKFAISPTAEKEFVALVSGYALLFTSFTASPELVPPQDLIPVAAVAQLKPRRGLSLFRTRIDQLFSLLRTTKLTPAACALLAEAPEHLKAETNWEELDLSNSGVNAETLQSLATAFTAINASREKLDCVENFDPVLLDLSHNKNGDGFIASVKDIVRSMPSITKLNLSYTELTVDSASSLKFLMSQRDFTSVSFAGNNAIPNTLLSSLETFKGSTSLLELNLSNCGIKSDKLFAALLELPALRELDLSSNKLDAGKFVKFMRKVSTLKALNVSGTLLKPSQVRKILEESPSRLTKLTARGMDLTPKFFASLSTMMQGGYPLETLDIGENKSRSGTEGALTLPRLKSLNLYAAAFPKSVSSVLPALKTGAISKLCLRACALSRESAVALLAALAESTTLEVLDLSANDDLPIDAVCALVTKCTSLRTLLLSATSMFVEPAAVEQLFAALAQSALTNLSLNNCKLSPKGVEALCAQLPNVKTLEVLSVRGAPLDQTLGTAFFKACKSAARLRKIDVTGAVGISDAYKISRKIGKSVIANGFRNDLLK